MGPNDPEFPEGDAWLDSMPDVRDNFAASAVRKVSGANPSADATAETEFKTFARLDLSNMGW